MAFGDKLTNGGFGDIVNKAKKATGAPIYRFADGAQNSGGITKLKSNASQVLGLPPISAPQDPGYAPGFGTPNKIGQPASAPSGSGAQPVNPNYAQGYGVPSQVNGGVGPVNPGYAPGYGIPNQVNGKPTVGQNALDWLGNTQDTPGTLFENNDTFTNLLTPDEELRSLVGDSIVDDLNSYNTDSMASRTARANLDASVAEARRQFLEEQTLRGRGDTGQIAGDSTQWFMNQALPAKMAQQANITAAEEAADAARVASGRSAFNEEMRTNLDVADLLLKDENLAQQYGLDLVKLKEDSKVTAHNIKMDLAEFGLKEDDFNRLLENDKFTQMVAKVTFLSDYSGDDPEMQAQIASYITSEMGPMLGYGEMQTQMMVGAINGDYSGVTNTQEYQSLPVDQQKEVLRQIGAAQAQERASELRVEKTPKAGTYANTVDSVNQARETGDYRLIPKDQNTLMYAEQLSNSLPSDYKSKYDQALNGARNPQSGMANIANDPAFAIILYDVVKNSAYSDVGDVTGYALQIYEGTATLDEVISRRGN